ncbi:MAG: glycosyltransferase [Acidobacteriota bacterium]
MPAPGVLHIIDTLELGGAERMAVELANAAHGRGWRAAVLTTRKGGPWKEAFSDGVVYECLERRARFDLRALPRLAKFEHRFRPSLIHVHGLPSALFVRAVRLFGLLRRPALIHEHFGEVHMRQQPRWVGGLLIDTFERLVAVSEQNAKWAVGAGFPVTHVRCVPNALNCGRIRSQQPLTLDSFLRHDIMRPCGAVVGRLFPQKGILTLLDALAVLPREMSWSVIVIGGGEATPYGRACVERVQQLGIQDRIFFVGQRVDVIPLVKACDFAVIPSLSESGPLVLIEYLACELPVVATAVGENTAMAARAGAVRTVPPGQTEPLAEAIAALIAMSPQERRAMGQRAWLATRELFDMERVFPTWEALYQEMLG